MQMLFFRLPTLLLLPQDYLRLITLLVNIFLKYYHRIKKNRVMHVGYHSLESALRLVSLTGYDVDQK